MKKVVLKKEDRINKPMFVEIPEVPTTVKDQERVEKKRHQIILAAVKLFSENGFHKTTLRHLAQASGISHGNIYDYVGSKKDILFLIHQYIADLIDETLLTVSREISDPVKRLREMIRSELKFIYEYDNAILLLYREAYILEKEYLKKILSREQYRISKYEAAIQECIDKGFIPECNVKLSANIIKCSMDAAVLRRWDFKKFTDPEEVEESFLRFIMNGIEVNRKFPL